MIKKKYSQSANKDNQSRSAAVFEGAGTSFSFSFDTPSH
jgi:hypothetical protein